MILSKLILILLILYNKMGNNTNKQRERWYEKNGRIHGQSFSKEDLRDTEKMMKMVRESIEKTGKFCIEFRYKQENEMKILFTEVVKEFEIDSQTVRGLDDDEDVYYFYKIGEKPEIPSVAYK